MGGVNIMSPNFTDEDKMGQEKILVSKQETLVEQE